jgi:hypothetical protein
VDELLLVNGIVEVSDLEPGPIIDGHYELRCEIKHLQATIKAMIALLPRSEG